MIIRNCKEEDLKVLAAIENTSFPIAPWKYEDYLNDFNDNECANIFVAEIDGHIIGYIDFWIMFEQATISKIAVVEPVRKHNIANIMLKEAIDFMEKSGVISITLEVRVSNIPAIKLYEKNGFIKKLVKKGYYSDGEDAFFMMREKEN